MFKQFHPFDKVAGVSIELSSEYQRISVCQIQLNKSMLSFNKKFSYIGLLKQLSGKLADNLVIALNITGKGILQKRISKTFVISAATFNDLLPNADLNEFYVQNFISGDYSYISAVRKSLADELTGQLTQIGYKVMILSLGPFVINQVINQINNYGAELVFDGHKVVFDDLQNWLSYQYQSSNSAPFPLKIQAEILNEDLLIPYAAAFQLLMAAKLDSIAVKAPDLAQSLANAMELQKIKAIGTISVISIFLLLILNLQAIAYLSTDNLKLSTQIGLRSQNVMNIQDLQNLISKKETFINDLGWDNGSSKVALIDRLAALLPPNLNWFNLSLNRVDVASSRVRRSVTFINNQIRVQGTSQTIVPVNEWIARVKGEQQVKGINLESYRFNDEKNIGEYTVIINF